MTCNPKWPEIVGSIKEGEVSTDRPDIVARVFRQKLIQLHALLHKKRGIFGEAISSMNVTEFQKRGLPHNHLLLILHPKDVPTTPRQIDEIICAQLPPDPSQFPPGKKKDQLIRLERLVLLHQSLILDFCKINDQPLLKQSGTSE